MLESLEVHSFAVGTLLLLLIIELGLFLLDSFFESVFLHELELGELAVGLFFDAFQTIGPV